MVLPRPQPWPVGDLGAASDVGCFPRGEVQRPQTAIAFRESRVNVSSLPEGSTRGQILQDEDQLELPALLSAPDHGADFKRATETAAAARPVPSLRTHFPALIDNYEALPPDTSGAVGPEHLVVMLNTEFAVQARRGRVLKQVLLKDFWKPAGASNVFDPRVVYDPRSRRYFATAIAEGQTTNSMILIGVSSTSDPAGDWRLLTLKADPTGKVWADFPNLGFNRTWLGVSFNMHTVGETNLFVRSDLYILDKAALVSAQNPSIKKFEDSNGFTLVPAVNHGGTEPNLYVVCDVPARNRLRIARIQGALGSETYAAGHALTPPVPAWGFWNVTSEQPNGTNLSPQKGTSTSIFPNDARIQSVQYRNSSLWVAHHVFMDLGTPKERTSIQWWNVSLAGAIAQRGLIDDPSGLEHYSFPSLAVNRSNDVLVGFSRFSKETYASAAYAHRMGSEPAGLMSLPQTYKAGEAPYVRIRIRGRNSWGDYSAACVDPLNDQDMWTMQEYASTRGPKGDRWGTEWAYFAFSTNDPGVVLSASPSRTVEELGQSVELSARVDGTPPLRLQWRRNGSNLAGATNATLTLPAFAARDQGDYVLLASNTFGYEFSAVIELAFAAPKITKQPAGGSYRAGSNVELSVAADGTKPLTYQWLFNGSVLVRATNATHLVSALEASKQGAYTVEVRNVAGNSRSEPARLQLLDLPPPVSPLLSGPRLDADRSLSFELLIDPVYPIGLQQSTNLVDWTFYAAYTSPSTRPPCAHFP